MRYFVELSYKGTNYHGWQIQPNATTVQEVLNNAFSTILRSNVQLTGAGRTDTGVHASYFVAHFDADIPETEDLTTLVFKLNGFLPNDIAIKSVRRVHDDAHARFDATSRTYHYFIHKQKNPFILEQSFYSSFDYNVRTMNDAAKVLFDYVDFTSFSKLHTDVKTNNCKIEKAEWIEIGEKLIFEIKADRFLRNMVRAIVGTLLEVGRGKLSIEEFRQVIEKKDRGAAGVSAPAQGLFLSGIEYPYFP